MIKFFRHIRKSLLMENKTSKYFKYAIGEIVLVVIGILIALQINNWNENRKTNKVEQNYLSSLNSEFQSNLQELKDHLKTQNAILKDSEFLLNLYEHDSITQVVNQRILYAIEGNGWGTISNYQKNIWQDLNSTGNTNIIKNKKLLKEVSLFYSRNEFYDKLLVEWNNYSYHFRKLTKDIIPPYVRIELADKIFDYWENNEQILQSEYQITEIFQKFKRTEGIGNALADIIQFRNMIEHIITIQITSANNLIDTLKSEIEN